MKSKKNGRSRLSIPIGLFFSRENITKSQKSKKKVLKNNINKSKKVKNRMLRMVGGKHNIWNGFSEIILPVKFLKGGKKSKKKRKLRRILTKAVGRKGILKMIKQNK
jgi:hypothetical protein